MTALARRRRETSAAPEVPPGPDDPHRLVGRLIKQVFTSLIRRIDERMQPLGLTAMQWEPMLLLSLKRADTVAALARESQVDCGAMTRMLDRLEEKQLLRRRRSEDDRRVVHLHLTPKGQKAVREILPVVFEELHVHLSDFRKDELVTLVQLLSRMLKNGARDA
jgi:DNA-binding MarR family transcriptional regulator